MPAGDSRRVWFPEMLARLEREGGKQCRSPAGEIVFPHHVKVEKYPFTSPKGRKEVHLGGIGE